MVRPRTTLMQILSTLETNLGRFLLSSCSSGTLHRTQAGHRSNSASRSDRFGETRESG